MNTIVQTLMPVIAIPALGYFYAQGNRFPLPEISKVNSQLLLPCLIFDALVSRQGDPFGDFSLLIATVLIVLVSGGLGFVVAGVARIQRDTLMPSMMFNNCGNIGIPLAMGISRELGNVAVLIFIVTNLLFCTVGTMIITKTIDLRRLFTTPVFLATASGLTISVLQPPQLQLLIQTLHICGAASPFLMLFCLGVTMHGLRPQDMHFGVWTGGLVRPAIGLLATVFVLLLPIPLSPDQKRLLLLFALLPPALLNFQMASASSAPRVSGMVFFGTVLSLAYIAMALPLIFPQTPDGGLAAQALHLLTEAHRPPLL
jgi:malate permease and related proteins